jgi:hypothetical protein
MKTRRSSWLVIDMAGGKIFDCIAASALQPASPQCKIRLRRQKAKSAANRSSLFATLREMVLAPRYLLL